MKEDDMKTGFGGVGGGTWRRGLLVTAAAWTMLAAAPLLPAEAAENDVLETVFTYSPPSGSGFDGWSSETADLSAYGGQTVRLALVKNIPDDTSSILQWAVDRVSVLADGVEVVTNGDFDSNTDGWTQLDANLGGSGSLIGSWRVVGFGDNPDGTSGVQGPWGGGGPMETTFYQDITIPSATTVALSFGWTPGSYSAGADTQTQSVEIREALCPARPSVQLSAQTLARRRPPAWTTRSRSAKRSRASTARTSP